MPEKLNLAIVCGTNNTERLFPSSALQRLRALGALRINPNREEPTPEQLIELAEEADVIITSWGSPQLTAEVMQKLPRLRYVAHAAGSVKPIVSDAMFDRGVRVTSSAKVLGMGVAETALGYTIACVKNLFNVSRGIHAGGWTKEAPLKEYDGIREMFEIKIGVVGGGMAGSHYMKLLSMFDVEILLYDPFISAEQARDRFCAQKVSLEELLSQAEGLDLTQYTEGSAAVFRMALASAQAVFADQTLSVEDQQTVDDAVASLKMAAEELTVKADGSDKEEQGGSEDSQKPDGTEQSGNNSDNGNAADTGNTGNADNGGSSVNNTQKAAKTGDAAQFGMFAVMVLMSGLVILKMRRGRA